MSIYLLISVGILFNRERCFPPLHLGFFAPVSSCSSGTVHSGYKGHVYKGQPVIRDRLAGTE